MNNQYIQRFKSIHEFHAAGYSIRYIAKTLKMSRNTVRTYIHGDFESLCQKKIQSIMHTYHDYIVKSLQAGMSRSDVYNSVIAKGYTGKRTAAYDYMNKIIEYYDIDISVYKSSSAEAIQKRKGMQKYDYVTRAELFKALWFNADIPANHKNYIFNKYPQLFELNICIKEFRQIFNERQMPLLFLFIEKYKTSNINALSTFATGMEKDNEAIENAIGSNLSNGFVEGTISKLKMIKRVMYGRCRLELLAAKMMYANPH
jgi:predicted transcriptional regulator